MKTDEDDLESAQRLRDATDRIGIELGRVVIGQKQVIRELLISLFAGGNCLLVGVPGLAKTLLVRSLAASLSLDFRRIQFTPDLMPSDITGTEVIHEDRATGERKLRFIPGPVFANVILADEINRTPPKTQAALLEAMQEHQVTVAGERREVPQPFFVLATQNPIEQEGTYPLPEAQLDRFMFLIHMDYPREDEELQIITETTASSPPSMTPTLTAHEILELCQLVRRVPVSDDVARLALRLCRLTRPQLADSPEFIKQFVSWGAGPRAGQGLLLGGKARALMEGRHFVTAEDLRAVAGPVLRHRIRTNFTAEAEGVTSDLLIERLMAFVCEDQDSPRREPFTQIFRSRHTR